MPLSRESYQKYPTKANLNNLTQAAKGLQPEEQQLIKDTYLPSDQQTQTQLREDINEILQKVDTESKTVEGIIKEDPQKYTNPCTYQ